MNETTTRFTEFAHERGYDPAALAVAWAGSHPAVTAPIIGARSLSQLEGSLKSLEIEMSPALREEISALSIEPPPATDRTDERSADTFTLRTKKGSMERKPIAIEEFNLNAYSFFEKDWLLLTSGDFTAGKFNAMTISWGSLGVMWGRPFAQVVVRPHRYTFEFMERYPTFTLCAFPKQYRRALSLLGSKSGRDGDKITKSGLTPTAASRIPAPAYAEAAWYLNAARSTGRITTRAISLTRISPAITRSKITTGYTLERSWQ